jgi:dTMP kinase
MPGNKRGVLISFEGVEGSGKTTQARALVDWLGNAGLPCVFVREPGGTEVGEMIRSILLHPGLKIDPRCETLLFLAARGQLVAETIMPALQGRKIVVTDRFADSTFAYQVCGRNLPPRLIAVFNRFAARGLKPDLTFLVEFDARKRGARGKDRDRMEAEDNDYHDRVRRGFLKLAGRARKRIKVLDGEKPVSELTLEITAKVKNLLINKGYKL